MTRRADNKPRSDSKLHGVIDAAVRDYESGLTIREVGEKYRVHHTNVLRVFRSIGVAIRPKSAATTAAIRSGRAIRPSGSDSALWRGGRATHSEGYVMIRCDHPKADVRGYVFEHVLVAEQMIGRPLAENEVAHHIDRNRQNNDPSNLQVMDRSEHQRMHGTEGAEARWSGRP